MTGPTAPRPRRIYWLWAVALALLVAAGLFCWLAVAPYLQVKAAVTRIRNHPSFNPTGAWWTLECVKTEVSQLGGGARAARKLSLYARLPVRFAPRQEMAVVMLGHCGRPGIPALMRLLPYEERGSVVATALTIVGEPAVPELVQVLESRDTEARVIAVSWLAEDRQEKTIGPLLKALANREQRVRDIAATGLVTLQGEVASRVRRELDSDDWRARAGALRALGELRDRAGAHMYANLLHDDVWQVRAEAAWALGRIEHHASLDNLLARLGDTSEHPDVRAAAAYALTEMRDVDTRAVVPLLDIISHSDSGLRYQSAVSLGSFGDARAVPVLIKALVDSDGTVRRAAAVALGEIGGEAKSAMPALEKLLKDPDPSVPSSARYALRAIRMELKKKEEK